MEMRTLRKIQERLNNENFVIEVGSGFIDASHFRRALEHFAIIQEFIIKYIKSDWKKCNNKI